MKIANLKKSTIDDNSLQNIFSSTANPLALADEECLREERTGEDTHIVRLVMEMLMYTDSPGVTNDRTPNLSRLVDVLNMEL